jgi:thiol-disulfide isomerase/thioredoxin
MRRVMPLIGGLILGLGLGIILFFGFLKPDETPKMSELSLGSEQLAVPAVDAPAPNFKLTSLSGEKIDIDDYHGRIVLLNFWATWCAPCRLEMPAFQSLSEQLADELVVVAVNNAEAPSDVQSFVDELNLSFEILLDPEAEVQRLYKVRGFPTTFFIDPKGIIRIQHIGLLTEEQLIVYLNELGLDSEL